MKKFIPAVIMLAVLLLQVIAPVSADETFVYDLEALLSGSVPCEGAVVSSDQPAAELLAESADDENYSWQSYHLQYGQQLTDTVTDTAKAIYDSLTDCFNNSFVLDSYSGTAVVDEIELNGVTVYSPHAAFAVQEVTFEKAADEDLKQAAAKFATQWIKEYETQIFAAMCAFSYDNPQYFMIRHSYIGQTYISGLTVKENNTTCHAKFFFRVGFVKFEELTASSSAVQSALSTVEDLLTDTALMSDAMKIAYWDNWLCANNVYNLSADEDENVLPWSMISALNPGGVEPVCEGYAKAMQLLCYSSQIPCVPICDVEHMWLAVQLDSQWYLLDCTWNDSSDPAQTASSAAYLLTAGDSRHKAVMSPLDPPDLSDSNYISAAQADTTEASWSLDADGICGAELLSAPCQIALYDQNGRFLAVKPCAAISWTAGQILNLPPVFEKDDLASASYAKRFVLDSSWAPQAELYEISQTTE